MNFFLLVTALFFSTASSVCTRLFTDLNKDKSISVFTFNLVSCFMWLLVLVPRHITNDNLCITANSAIYGVFYGLLLFAFLHSSYRAVDEGPYAITKLINCPSFIIPTLFGVIYYNEGITTNRIIGMILVCISLCMCVNPAYSGEKLTLKWFIYSFVYFISNSLIGVVYKLFGGVSSGNDYDAMLMFAAITAIVLYAVFLMIEHCKSKEMIKLPKGKKTVLMLLAGLFTCIFIRLNLYLSNVIPSAIIFPVTNCATVLLSTFIGMVVFKEKLSKVQFSGIAIGIVAIIITNL